MSTLWYVGFLIVGWVLRDIGVGERDGLAPLLAKKWKERQQKAAEEAAEAMLPKKP